MGGSYAPRLFIAQDRKATTFIHIEVPGEGSRVQQRSDSNQPHWFEFARDNRARSRLRNRGGIGGAEALGRSEDLPNVAGRPHASRYRLRQNRSCHLSLV